MNIHFVYDKDIKKEKEEIEEKIKNGNDTIFILKHPNTRLNTYIDKLHDNAGLDENSLFKLKICYEKENIDLSYSEGNAINEKITSMSHLIKKLDAKNSCKIVVNDDKRITLADVVQQLIYISYPLQKVNIMLKKEEKDAEKVKAFMEHIDELQKSVDKSIDNTNNIVVNNLKHQTIKDNMIKQLNDIKMAIMNTKGKELKIAVAASKKTGKSVIVNSMIGAELAPTSLEMATPNTCVYKKSCDNQYHLDYNNDRFHFNSSDGLYNKIKEEFKIAQSGEKEKEKFAIPDMTIEYVTEKNNFSAYTIFDTAGPDAAGTSHSKKAEEAMEKCDVAIFAIDYSKYLTDSEESYLKDVKTLFEKNNKFHSLIFTINKIDARYTDPKETKSIIKSIDFIRSRLSQIDECYKDCIIFATSALQYFSCLQAEQYCGEDIKDSKDLYEEIRSIKKKYKSNMEVVGRLNFISNQTEALYDYHDIENITIDDLKHYSGMPDLLNYISYIMQSKAREEVINSVTFNIDSQRKIIKSYINYISNLENLIAEKDETIVEITKVIDNFVHNTQEILSKNFKQYEVDHTKSINNYVKKAAKKNSFGSIVDGLKKEVKQASPTQYKIQQKFFDQIQAYTKSEFQKIVGQKNLTDDEINNILDKKVILQKAKDILQSEQKQIIERNTKDLENIKEETVVIMKNRMEKLEKELDNFKKNLLKYNNTYSLPELPEFSFDMPQMSIKELKINTEFRILTKILPNLTKAQRKFFFFKSNKYKIVTSEKMKNFEKEFRGLYQSICNIENEIGLYKTLEQVVDEFCNMCEQEIEKMEQNFQKANDTFQQSLASFKETVDDREIYRNDKQKLEKEKEFRHKIDESVKCFTDLWDKILEV